MINDVIQGIQSTISEKIPDGLIVARHDDEGHKYEYTPSGIIYRSVTTKTGIIEVGSRLKDWAAGCSVEYLDRNWNIITPENRADHYQAARREHSDRLKDAGGIGTKGHAIIENYIKQWLHSKVRPQEITAFIPNDEMDKRAWAITRSAQLFFKDFEVLPVASELKICSIKHSFAGTLDCLAFLPRLTHGDEICAQSTLAGTMEGHAWGGYGNPKKECYEHCMNCDATRKWVFCLLDFKSSNSIQEKPSYSMQTAAYWHGLFELTGLKPEEMIIIRLDKMQAKYEALRVVSRAKSFRAFQHVSKAYDLLTDGSLQAVPLVAKKEINLF